MLRSRTPIGRFLPVHSTVLLMVLTFGAPAITAQAAETASAIRPVAAMGPRRFSWPSWDVWMRVLSMRDYNTRVVALGTLLLGVSAGTVGVFMLMRRRSLAGDVISHASLPGIAVAFLVLEAWNPGSGKSLPGLLAGALVTGTLGIFCTTLITRYSRIKQDAALALVLSVFFGLGAALLTVIQGIPSGNAAGLQQFVFGKAASMVASDVWLIAAAAAIIVLLVTLLFKELSMLAFDHRFAGAQGWPVGLLDLLLMFMVSGVTVIALQSVGLLLAVAMLVIPASSARFWTDRILPLTAIAACFGGASALMGVLISALFPRLAAGAVIVLCGSTLFLASMMIGKQRGLWMRWRIQSRLQSRIGRQHLLRAFFEYFEPRLPCDGDPGVALTEHVARIDDLVPMRSWRHHRLRRLLARAEAQGLVALIGEGEYRLTQRGAEEAWRVVRNHRLWELYLIEYADIAPSHVDRDADDIEHLLSPQVIVELRRLLDERFPQSRVPPSPHAMDHESPAGNVR